MFGMPLKSALLRARDRSGRQSRETGLMPQNSNVGDRYDVPGTRCPRNSTIAYLLRNDRFYGMTVKRT